MSGAHLAPAQVIMKGDKELVGTLRGALPARAACLSLSGPWLSARSPGFDVYVNMVLEDVIE